MNFWIFGLMFYTQTPVQEILHPMLEEKNLRLLIKREDLNHSYISGNKWWKLKYNLIEAQHQQLNTLLTFGGAYSNHIYATAAAANELQLKSIGIIRGEDVSNPTLDFAKQKGMQLHFITRGQYRKKQDESLINYLIKIYGNFYFIPEGGTNKHAVKGCEEFVKSLLSITFDYVCLPVGTGGTMAGIICGLAGQKEILGYTVLKQGECLYSDVENLVFDYTKQSFNNWHLKTEYSFGGYAKYNNTLVEFIQDIELNYKLPLDQVYTGKLFFGILEDVKKGIFKEGSTILAIHTGGLQGRFKIT